MLKFNRKVCQHSRTTRRLLCICGISACFTMLHRKPTAMDQRRENSNACPVLHARQTISNLDTCRGTLDMCASCIMTTLNASDAHMALPSIGDLTVRGMIPHGRISQCLRTYLQHMRCYAPVLLVEAAAAVTYRAYSAAKSDHMHIYICGFQVSADNRNAMHSLSGCETFSLVCCNRASTRTADAADIRHPEAVDTPHP